MKNYRYLLSLIILIPFAVSAQDNEDANASEVEEVVVVGSQIKGAKLLELYPFLLSLLMTLTHLVLIQVMSFLITSQNLVKIHLTKMSSAEDITLLEETLVPLT